MTLVKGGKFCAVTVWGMSSRSSGLDARTRVIAVANTPDGGAAYICTAYDLRGRMRKSPETRHFDEPAEAHAYALGEVGRYEARHGYRMCADPRTTRVRLAPGILAMNGNLTPNAAEHLADRLRRSLMRAGEWV